MRAWVPELVLVQALGSVPGRALARVSERGQAWAPALEPALELELELELELAREPVPGRGLVRQALVRPRVLAPSRRPRHRRQPARWSAAAKAEPGSWVGERNAS